jgi:hypothetical protein
VLGNLFAIEHIVLLMVAMIFIFVPSVPQAVIDEGKRQAYVKTQAQRKLTRARLANAGSD